MDTLENPQPQINPEPMPQTPQAEAVPPVQPPPPIKKTGGFNLQSLIPLIIAIAAIAVGIGIFSFIQSSSKPPEQQPPITIVVTPIPTPTPVRIVTQVSQTEAFIILVNNVATLSAQINEFEKSDPSLSPPSLVLPLGL